MVSFEGIVIGAILLIIGILFFYFKNYFSEKIVQIVMIILGIIFIIVGIYYLATALIPGESIVVDN